MTIFSIGHMWKKGGKISKFTESMEVKVVKMEWNDCSKCKNFDTCYYHPLSSGLNPMHVDIVNIAASQSWRDLCVNNGKRNFKDKDNKKN